MRDRISAYRILVGKPQGIKLLGRLKRKWKDNIKMDLRELGWENGLDRSGSGYGQVTSSCKHGNEPSVPLNAGLFLN